MTTDTTHQHSGRWDAALDIIRATDLLITLDAAGRHPTTGDLYRAESARARWDGRPPTSARGRSA